MDLTFLFWCVCMIVFGAMCLWRLNKGHAEQTWRKDHTNIMTFMTESHDKGQKHMTSALHNENVHEMPPTRILSGASGPVGSRSWWLSTWKQKEKRQIHRGRHGPRLPFQGLFTLVRLNPPYTWGRVVQSTLEWYLYPQTVFSKC